MAINPLTGHWEDPADFAAVVPAEDGRACERGCGWRNTWRDSGDRGAAQHYHDTFECPNRLSI